jgi:hypothetical protein
MHGRFGGWNWIVQFYFGRFGAAQMNVRNNTFLAVIESNFRLLLAGPGDFAVRSGLMTSKTADPAGIDVRGVISITPPPPNA